MIRTGNPWVLLMVPVPLPVETRTHSGGTGICAGYLIYTPGIPVPVPVMGYPWVYNYLISTFLNTYIIKYK